MEQNNYQSEPEDITRAKAHAGAIANGVGLLVAAGAFATDIARLRAFEWIGLIWAVSLGLAAWGGTYAVVYVAIKLLPSLLLPPPEAGSGQAGERKTGSGKQPESPKQARPPADPIYIQLRRALPAEWFDKVNWRGLAQYVATDTDPEFSRSALLPWVGHFIFSRRDPADQTPTFPEEMVRIGAAETIHGGYEWTGRGIAIMKEIHRELTPPTPQAAGYANDSVPVT